MCRKKEAIVGTIAREYIRCGRNECKCATSDYRHGPYYYLRWREWAEETGSWRQRKRYIPRGDLKRERARLRQARRRLRLRRQAEREAEARERRERHWFYFSESTDPAVYRLLRDVDRLHRYIERINRRAKRKATWLSIWEFSERTGLTISELAELNRIRLLCPQGGWNPDVRRLERRRYRPNLVLWGQKLRRRHEAGETWGELKEWTRKRWSRGA